MNNSYFVFMDSVYQKLGKASVGMSELCSIVFWSSAGKIWGLEGDYESLKSFEGFFTHVWWLMLAVS